MSNLKQLIYQSAIEFVKNVDRTKLDETGLQLLDAFNIVIDFHNGTNFIKAGSNSKLPDGIVETRLLKILKRNVNKEFRANKLLPYFQHSKTAIKTQEIEFALSSLAKKGLIKSIQNISPSQGKLSYSYSFVD